MAITFNDQYANIYNAYFYNSGAGTYTALGADGISIDYFPETTVVGNCVVFSVDRLEAGKFNELKFNVLTALAATSITVVWEYARLTGGSVSAPAWYALSGVTDGTNAFQTAGINSVTFTCPEDWENYMYPSGIVIYGWHVRARITAVSGLTEGGKQAASAITCKPVTIWVSGYAEATPVVLADIKSADTAGGWGVVTNTGQAYSFNCGLNFASGCYWTTKQELIQFLKNWDIWVYGVIKSGEIVSGDKVKNGSLFIFNQYNGDLNGVLAYNNAEIYNTTYKYISLTGSTQRHGHWGGQLGTKAGQKIIDLYVEGMLVFDFAENTNSLIGAKGYNIFYHVGAILKNITCYGGDYLIVLEYYLPNCYTHVSDVSGAIISPVSASRATRANPFVFNFVDCNFGTFADINKVYWNINVADAYYQGWCWETYSFLLRVEDENGNAIASANVLLKDNTAATTFDYTTTAEGYIGQDSGTVSSATASTLNDSSKSWATDAWRFQEVYITAGTGAGQRRIIKKGNTGTSLPITPDWVVTPDATSKYIIIPYVRSKKILSPATKPGTTGYYWSTVTDLNPFTLTVSKAGTNFLTIAKEVTFDRAVDWRMTMVDVADIVTGIADIKGTGFVKDTHSLPQCLTAIGFSTLTAGQVNTEVDTALADYDAPTKAEMDSAFTTAQNDLNILTGADGVILATNQANYAPAKVSDLGTVQSADHTVAIADIPTVAEFNARSLPSADYVITTDTIAGVTTVTNLTNAPTTGDLTAAMKASVNAEIVDALNVDTYAEPGQEIPPATNTLIQKIGYLYKLMRNKLTQTDTEIKVYNDAGDVVDQKAVVSDDRTTYTRGKFGSGV